MRDRYFEDWAVGERLETASVVLTEEQIVAFAREFDPQPFHLDPEAAGASMFGRLIASGWHTAAVTMRLLVDSGMFGARGAVGLGVDGLRWMKPVYPGDTLSVVAEVLEKRATPGKPNGVLHVRMTTRNQRGEDVMTQTAAILALRREFAQP